MHRSFQPSRVADQQHDGVHVLVALNLVLAPIAILEDEFLPFTSGKF
jgi:hypothetical protein